MNSELISRGWVYQETHLTPANLFCTGNQLWWSCSSKTYSRAFPLGIPGDGQILLKLPREKDFIDNFRERRLDTMRAGKYSGNIPAFAWRDVIETYCRTSVTVPDDRLVALAGIARLYGSRMRSKGVGSARYHSGVWSGVAEDILLWHIAEEPPSSQPPSQYPIPSWSPLCQHGPIRLVYPTVATNQYLFEYVNMTTSGLDRFGRCRTREDGTLKLRGVLIDIRFSNNYNRLYPKGYKGYTTKIWWDNYENQRLAKADEMSSWCGLVCAVADGFPNDQHRGLLLRAYDNRSTPTRKGRTWRRCGYFDIDISDHCRTKNDINRISRAFRLERYGFKLKWGSGRYGRGTYGLEFTGAVQDLEDVCIV